MDPSDGSNGSSAKPRSLAAQFINFTSEKLGIDNNTFITAISGSTSGFAATFAKQPIQRIKWIRQVHEGPPVPYKNIIKETHAKLGARGFFAGSMAAIYRNVPHSMLAYTIYPKAETFVFKLQVWMGQDEVAASNRKRGFATRFWAGYITLFATTVITHPLDTLRVRLSVHAYTVGDGAWKTGRTMLAGEGVKSFYRGFGATLLGAGPRGALGFGVFETLKPLLGKSGGLLERHKGLSSFLCGYLAGLASEFFTYPLDTVRRRQQALGDATYVGRNHVGHALQHIWRTEKFRGMYKGVSLNLVKNPLATAVSFFVNDRVKENLGYVGSGPGLSNREKR